MKRMLPLLIAGALLLGCDRADVPAPAVEPSAPEVAQAPATESPPQPARVSPEEWLNNPIFKKRNPYDLPLEIEIKEPKLPPKEVMEPAKPLPPE